MFDLTKKWDSSNRSADIQYFIGNPERDALSKMGDSEHKTWNCKRKNLGWSLYKLFFLGSARAPLRTPKSACCGARADPMKNQKSRKISHWVRTHWADPQDKRMAPTEIGISAAKRKGGWFLKVRYGGFHSHGGTPIGGWFISWKIPSRNGWFGGTPILGNLHMLYI